jgi:hypothetical protein
MTTSSQIRLENLIKFCQSIGMVKTTSPAPSPTALGRAIDRNTNYCSDLLLGRRSFGDEIARHIEQKLKLPRWYLDDEANLKATSKSRAKKLQGVKSAVKNDTDPTLQEFFAQSELAQQLSTLSKAQRLKAISAALEAVKEAKPPSVAAQKKAKKAEAPVSAAGRKKAKKV